MNDRLRFVGVLLALSLAGCADAEPDDWAPGANAAGKADGATAETAAFFAPGSFYMVQVDGWPGDRMSPDSLAEALSFPGASVRITEADPNADPHCSAGGDAVVHETSDFSLRTSGNFTNGTPKSSYKIRFTSREARMYGMRALNLKSMWNDVSQMREAVAWSMFGEAGLHAPRHTYARFCINDRYYGLYSVIEQVDRSFLRRHFGRGNDDGNLYKAYWEDIGPANLTHRHDGADDSGRQYYTSEHMDERTYQLKTNDDEDDPVELQSYDDLAWFARAINGVGGCSDDGCWVLGGGCNADGCWEAGEPECASGSDHCDAGFDPQDRRTDRFASDAYRESVESIFDARTFLRWAAVNMLLGAWDNYWGTPSNYYLYNSGRDDGGDEFMEQPYFHFVPWDYDNSLGNDFFDVEWHRAEIVDLEAATAGYYDDGQTSNLPLLRNLLANPELRAYYLDFLEHFVGSTFNEEWLSTRIGTEGSGGIWDTIRHSAFLESDSSRGAPHTGRQWTNDQVYWNGFEHHEIWQGEQHTIGILHYVRMRHDEAVGDLERWRQAHASGESGARFPAAPGDLPAYVPDTPPPADNQPSAPGQIVITEIMNNPKAASDGDAEWLELHNPTDEVLNLRGCLLTDDVSDTGTPIAEDLLVEPGAYVTVAVSDQPGFTPTYSYDGAFGLSNSAESPALRCGTVVIDTVDYGAAGFDPSGGEAMQLDPSAINHEANDDGGVWCLATDPYAEADGDTNHGTPGMANPACF